jgi:hypothetical protein
VSVSQERWYKTRTKVAWIVAKAPERVSVASRLAADVVALTRFTSSKEPPKRAVRPLASTSVFVGFGDASGLGFGYNQIKAEAALDQDRYKKARDGDDFMICFQCDMRQFRNMQQRDPNETKEDAFLMLWIRRAILDSFWSREPSTVDGNIHEGTQVDRAAARLGFEGYTDSSRLFSRGRHVGSSNCMYLCRF